MKIRQIPSSWDALESLPKIPRVAPAKPLFVLRLLIRLLSIPDLLATHFTYTDLRGAYKGKGPYFILMNHSSFLDLKMASKILFPHPYAIVSTADAFVGKSLLMRLIGCVQTQKFVTDASLVMTLIRLIKKQKRSVLMYPEAGYTFDGRATPLPDRLGGLLKRLDVPVILIRSDAGGFLRDPLYNELRLRRVKARATVSCLLTPEDLREMSVEQIDAVLKDAFSFDHFREGKEKGLLVKRPDRATGLHRILYRCPHCHAEGQMLGEGTRLTCRACGEAYEMAEDSSLSRLGGETVFAHIPHWVDWQRDCARAEALTEGYSRAVPVSVSALCDHKGLYTLGRGTLVHDQTGLSLYSDKGTLIHHQGVHASHTIGADLYFYALGDVISLGTKDRLFYCFPEDNTPVYKLRLAAEELYRAL